MYDFDFNPDRANTSSLKWDVKSGELPMWVADMDFCCPPSVTKAIEERAKHGIFGYTITGDEWYESIINWWNTRHGVKIEREWLQFCTGVVPAISSIVKRITEVGDNVAVLTPVYDIFFHSIENFGRHVAECRLKYEDGRYSIDFIKLEEVLSDPLTTMLILCNPHNPTGNIWTREELLKISALAKKHGAVVLSDEIHCDITITGRSYTPYLSVSDEGIVCVSASKAFNIAGLQSAAVIVPQKHLRERVARGLNSDEVAEPNCFAAIAAAEAFKCGQWLDELRDYLTSNREEAEKRLSEIDGIRVVKAEATYLVWIDCSLITQNTDELCEFLRESEGLILSEGSQYRGGGESFLRMNIACNRQKLSDGLERFKRGIAKFREKRA